MLGTALLFLRRVPAWAWIALAILSLSFIIMRVIDAYGDRRAEAERAKMEAQVERDRLAQREREAAATAILIQQRQRDQVEAGQRKQEIDNATSNIPDTTPSARQRARVCLELRRQAKANGRPEPAC